MPLLLSINGFVQESCYYPRERVHERVYIRERKRKSDAFIPSERPLS